MTYFLLLAAVLIFSVLASSAYLHWGRKYGPYARPNFRSLHKTVIPRGGGAAIAVSALAGCIYLYSTGRLSFGEFLVYIPGGAIVAAAGAVDDRLDVPARYRLPIQVLAAGWVCFWLGGLPALDLGFATISLGWLGHLGLLVACVWFYNLYNFIDGIDGMASSATLFICLAMGIILCRAQQQVLAIILGLLAVSNAGFLAFNWAPAKMFMGDAGSSFMGYIISAVFVESLWHNAASIWSWLIVGGFYFADTTLTTVVRLLTVPGWYRPHRSHAYQNLARVWNSHRSVVLLVLAIDFLWVVPLLLLSLKYEAWAIGVTLLAYVPLAMFCLKYGPLYANK